MEANKSAMSKWQAFEMNRTTTKIEKIMRKIVSVWTVKGMWLKNKIKENPEIYLDWPCAYMHISICAPTVYSPVQLSNISLVSLSSNKQGPAYRNSTHLCDWWLVSQRPLLLIRTEDLVITINCWWRPLKECLHWWVVHLDRETTLSHLISICQMR